VPLSGALPPAVYSLAVCPLALVRALSAGSAWRYEAVASRRSRRNRLLQPPLPPLPCHRLGVLDQRQPDREAAVLGGVVTIYVGCQNRSRGALCVFSGSADVAQYGALWCCVE